MIFKATNLEAAQDRQRIRRARRQQDKYRYLLHMSDVWLGRLEKLNLAGRTIVPIEYRQDLHRLVGEMDIEPSEYYTVTAKAGKVLTVMKGLDLIFDFQEALFDPKRRRLGLDTEDAEGVESEAAFPPAGNDN